MILPNGVDEMSCQASAATRLVLNPNTGNSYLVVGPVDFFFTTLELGLFEAVLTVDFGYEHPTLGSENFPLGLVTGGSAELRDHAPPTAPFVPSLLEVGRTTWSQRQLFPGGRLHFTMQFEDRLLTSLYQQGIPSPPPYEYDLTVDVRMTLRRVQDRCYMLAWVTGGQGAGTYSGDVAVLGNPTGVSDSTLDMWFGDPDDTAENQMFQDFQDAISSAAGQQAIQGATEEQMAQLQEVYRNLGQAAEESDPIKEVRETLVLTLEDVKFDAAPPGSSLEALMKMAGHFVLAAQLASGDWEPVYSEGGFSLPVENVGVKGPGLGLASTASNCGAPSESPTVVVRPCDPDDDQRALELDQIGAVCGGVRAKVFNEQCQELTIDARFLAGRSIEQCIR